MAVEPLLHGIDHGFVLPTLDAALLAGRALGLQRTVTALGRPVDVEVHDVAVLRIPNVVGGQIDWSDLKYANLPEKERANTDLRIGDVLFVRTNGNPEYIGRCATFDGGRQASYASYLIRARLDQNLLPTFVVNHFNHERYRPMMVRAGRTTAGNYNLSTQGLGALPVILPPSPIQSAFAQQAQHVEATARALDAAADKADAMAAALSASIFEDARRDSSPQ